MTKYQQIAEPDGDGTPSRRATDELTGTGSPSVAPIVPAVADAPVYLTRREAREAERRAAARSAAPTAPAVSAAPAVPTPPVGVVDPALATEAPTPTSRTAPTAAT